MLASLHIRQWHDDLAIESAWTQQCRIKHVRTVGCSDDDDPFAAFKTIHFYEQLIQGLLALIMTAAEACTTMATDRVYLVNEDDAGSVFLGLLEHVANARCADADEHLDEIGTRNRKERNLGLARYGLGQQGFTGTGRTDHQDAARNLSTELGELARITKKFDQFRNLVLGLIAAGHIGKRDLDLILALQFGSRAPERHRSAPAATGLHLAHEVEDEPKDDDQRQPVKQQPEQDRHRRISRLDLDLLHILFDVTDRLLGQQRGRAHIGAVLQFGLHGAAIVVHEHFVDALVAHGLHELGVRNILRRCGMRIETLEHRQQDDGDYHPEQHSLCHVVHSFTHLLLQQRRSEFSAGGQCIDFVAARP